MERRGWARITLPVGTVEIPSLLATENVQKILCRTQSKPTERIVFCRSESPVNSCSASALHPGYACLSRSIIVSSLQNLDEQPFPNEEREYGAH